MGVTVGVPNALFGKGGEVINANVNLISVPNMLFPLLMPRPGFTGGPNFAEGGREECLDFADVGGGGFDVVEPERGAKV